LTRPLLLAALAALAIYLYVGSRLAAPALRPVGPPPTALDAESVHIPSQSGTILAAWFATPEHPQAAIVLLHGIGGNRVDMLPRAELLWRSGYAVLLPDLQAHGESPGGAITFGYLESRDAVAVVDYLHQRLPGLPVGGVGVSLGGAAFLLASGSLDIDALVVESVYPTIEEAVDNRIDHVVGPLSRVLTPALLAQLRPRLGFWPSALRPIDHIGAIGCPVLVVSGGLDPHTTQAETRRLFAAAHEPKQLWLVPRAEHEDLYRFAPKVWEATVLTFFGKHLDRLSLL